MTSRFASSRLVNLVREIRRAEGRRLQKFSQILADKIRHVAGPLIMDEKIIYVWRGYPGPPLSEAGKNLGDLLIFRFADVREVADHYWPVLEQIGPRGRRAEYQAFFSEDNVLWIGDCGGEAVCVACSFKAGRREWLIPLGPEDVVIFSVSTSLGFKGLGLAPKLVRHVAESEKKADADVYLDTKRWNVAAQKAFEKIGFVRLVEKRP